jgi:hypothetical protein
MHLKVMPTNSFRSCTLATQCQFILVPQRMCVYNKNNIFYNTFQHKSLQEYIFNQWTRKSKYYKSLLYKITCFLFLHQFLSEALKMEEACSSKILHTTYQIAVFQPSSQQCEITMCFSMCIYATIIRILSQYVNFQLKRVPFIYHRAC